MTKNYPAISAKLLADGGRFIGAVVEESAPRTGKDGLVTMTTQAVVDVRAVQKSLNQLSRAERIDLIRAGGDPKISVQISARDADRPDVPPRPSPVAENLVKERIKSFGFRTWSEAGPTPRRAPTSPSPARPRSSDCRCGSKPRASSSPSTRSRRGP